MAARGSIHVGTSGWHYAHWKDVFYPADVSTTAWLEYYSARFCTTEINASFYRLPGEHALRSWFDATPDDFVFSIKASRFITHMKKLKDPESSLPPFLHQAALLGEKLGPVLFQLPPRWRLNPGRLNDFLEIIPSRYRCAFEFRDPSWFDTRVYAILEKHRAAFCIHDLDQRLSPIEVTADFVYIRLHGPEGAYHGSYGDRSLREWASRMLAWQRAGKQVYCYFDNDQSGYAPRNAMTLQRMVRQSEA